MKRLPLIATFATLCTLTLLTACGTTGSGYTRGGVWDFNSTTEKAKADPSALLIEEKAAQAEEKMIEGENMAAPAEQQPPAPQGAVRPNLPPVKVAILLPLTGQNEKLGQAMLNAAQIALFDVGHNNFELMPYDTQGTAHGARAAAQEALQNKSQMVLGPVFARAAAAAKPVLNGAGVPMLTFTTDWTLAGSGTFVMGFLPYDQVERIVRYTAANGYTDIGVITGTNDYGNVVLNAYNQYAAETGLRTIAAERISPRARNITNMMRDFARYDARKGEDGQTSAPPFQALFMPLGGESAIAVSTLADQYDMRASDVRRIGTGLWDDGSLATEPSMNGAWFAAPSPDERADFMRRYFETYGVSPPRLSTLAYDATALTAILARNGLSQGRGPDFGPAALTNPNGFAGIDGIFRFRPTGLVERGLAVLEYKHGNIIVKDPAPRSFQARGF